jgi:Bacterial regulatory proteins, tetR family
LVVYSGSVECTCGGYTRVSEHRLDLFECSLDCLGILPKKRSTYHHGDLRTALIETADGIIAEGDIEAFSLRAAAQRAGVSPGAPAHHFGSARGLLTTLQGLAHLLEEKAAHFIRKATSRQFVNKELPKVLERLYPDHKVAKPAFQSLRCSGGSKASPRRSRA